jgi:NAD+ diphosphatase
MLAMSPPVISVLTEPSAHTGYAAFGLDRHSEQREDSAFIDGLRGDPRRRFLAFVGEAPLLRPDGSAWFDEATITSLGDPAGTVFLGTEAAGPLFGVGLPASLRPEIEARSDVVVGDLRALALEARLPPAVLGPLGAAKALISWHARHRFCANCGQPSTVSCSGWRRDCPACGTQHFPRVDPVVIMLIVHGDRCLLGRSGRFGSGMYSCLAGFLEPGETAEDCVRRETREEVGVPVGRVGYFATQPWPFPSSLMMGFRAEALGTELVIDKNELEDARWFDRAEVRLMLDRTHREGLTAPFPFAIAHHLIRDFVENGSSFSAG